MEIQHGPKVGDGAETSDADTISKPSSNETAAKVREVFVRFFKEKELM